LFLGASWKLFRLPGDLVCNIISKEAYRKPQKASRKLQKIQGRNPDIISLVIWKKQSFHKDILKLTDLQNSVILTQLYFVLIHSMEYISK
jgi:hypothetical protein